MGNDNDKHDTASLSSAPPPYATLDDNVSTYSDTTAYSRDTLGDPLNATVQPDGRIEIDLSSKLIRTASFVRASHEWQRPSEPITPYEGSIAHLNIVIQIVGSRGDVQPFLALGNELKRSGHRIRIATHNNFRDFVTSAGLEFYPIGGDPNELMAYMVRNPGLIPKMKTLRDGEISKKREMVAEMLDGCWASCLEPDDQTGSPFVADAIIANPPSFAHIHCAQALGIPLHLMFTMPWSATRQFPHPLVNLKADKMEPGIANYLSYAAVEWLTWQGLGDVINRWRAEHELEPIPMMEGPFLAYTLQIPMTYCWSGALVPKPKDWPAHIDVCGFFFRDEPEYTPPDDLRRFLDNGTKPIYIGFGSIVAENPELLTTIIEGAVKHAGVRCILSKGWSNLGAGIESENVFLLGDCPHEWLFQQVAGVIHHGGAGTTACGLKYGAPTAVVPFFGDQPFWGHMVASAGAGPRPIHHKALTVDNLTDAIRYLLKPETKQAAKQISQQMVHENGVTTAADSFHRFLPWANNACEVLPNQPAAWKYKVKKRTVRLSKLAVESLVKTSTIEAKKLELHEPKPWHIEPRRWDPMTGGISAALGGFYDAGQTLSTIGSKKKKKSAPALPSTSSSASVSANSAEVVSTATPPTASQPAESSLTSARDARAAECSGASMTALETSKDAGIKFSRAVGELVRAGAVDAPYAFAQGLHQAPRLYGESPRDFGPITDWKSGGVVAGKEFAFGMYDGLAGFFMEPIKGGMEGGPAGAAKGFGYGLGGLYFKTLGGLAGLLGYPLQGLYKTVYNAIHTKTKKEVALGKRVEGLWLLKRTEQEQPGLVEEVVAGFKRLS